MESINTIADVARRVERAYRLQVGTVRSLEEGSRVWLQAAHSLIYLHQLDPSMPIDPELFVVAQPSSRRTGDPVRDLTGMNALLHYQRRVRGIVRQLRREIRGELQWIDRQQARGLSLESILILPNRRVSPLGQYLSALRNHRPDLALAFRDAALRQSDACPLYQDAIQQFLPQPIATADPLRHALIERKPLVQTRLAEQN